MERFLLIRFSSLGDVILTTPVTKALKQNYPGCSVHVLVKRQFSDIFRGSPFVDKTIEYDEKLGSSFSALRRFSHELDKNDYTTVIDLHSSLRSRVIRVFLHSRKKITYKKSALKRRLLVKFKARFKNMPHSVDKYLDTLKQLGITTVDRIPFVHPSKDDETFARDFFTKNNATESLKIAICPGAQNRAKMYPHEKFTELINELHNNFNVFVILLGSNADKEVISKIQSAVKNSKQVASLTDSTLLQSAAILKNCDRLVTNDSGPMHLSVAVGTPLVALFGPTDKDFGFYPLGKNDVVLSRGYNCSPCSLHGKKECVKYDYRCLNDISVNEIVKALSL